MAQTTVIAGDIITITLSDTSDWDSQTFFPAGVRLTGIKFFGSAGDVLVVRHGSATGNVISKVKDASGNGAKDSMTIPLDCKPYLKYADCTFGTPANVTIMLELA